ncbi:hypothetical protein WQ54_31540 [Bacillus sp. SA1-12]|nr:hypothetical protein WQ54_31540 [Bacillus sp. SA1-12]
MEGTPFNDAMNHLGLIEGYPIPKPYESQFKQLAITHTYNYYFLKGSISLGVLTVIVLNFIK